MTKTPPDLTLADPPSSGFRRSALIAAALACGAGFAFVAALVVAGAADGVDRTIMLLLSANATMQAGSGVGQGTGSHSLALVEAMRAITALGSVALRNLAALVATAALLLMACKREALVLAGTVATGWGANTMTKLLVARPRPDLFEHLTQASGPSFPSGHSFNGTVALVAIALAFGACIDRAGPRVALLASALLLGAMIAFSRVWLGVHWPSDALAGWLGGAGWALAAHGLTRERTSA